MKTPRRRWLRFSLRTLFGITALVAVGAWGIVSPLNWIAARERLLSEPGVYMPLPEYMIPPLPPRQAVDAPFPLWLFGEKGVPILIVPFGADRDLVKSLFPESEVIACE